MHRCEPARNLTSIVFGIAALSWIGLFWQERAASGLPLCCNPAGLFALPGSYPIEKCFRGSLLFLAGWLLMTIAMMLPTILPSIEPFRRFTSGLQRQYALIVSVLVGYVSVWFLSGIVIVVFSVTARNTLGSTLGFVSNRGIFAPLLFLLAGLFQFVPAKRRCLARCREPQGPANKGWESSRPIWSSYRRGFSHGVACIGSCGCLMLLMFAVEQTHVVWMMFLTVVMAIEKNAAWGPKLAKPVGILLLVGAILTLVTTGRPGI